MEENKITFKKIELRSFIQTLMEVYDSGADYIDLVGVVDDDQDLISIVVHDEYLMEEEEEDDELPELGEFSDDDIDKLL